MNQKQYLAIDIGGTSVKLGVVDETGAVLAKAEESVSFDGYETRESVTDSVPFNVEILNSATGESLTYSCRMHTYSDAASLLVDREYTLAG